MIPAQQLDADIAAWQQLTTWIKQAKEREKAMRISLASRMFNSVKLPNGAFPEGITSLVATGEHASYRGALQSSWKREILEELLIPTLTEAMLTPDQQTALIKMNPVLSVKGYRALPVEKQMIVDKMIVTKQSTISLEVTTLPKQ